MVNIQYLEDLINNEDIKQRNVALRRAFYSYTEPLDITGNETIALIVLLNLTYSKKLVDDLLDKKLAKKTLKNQDHIGKCINEVQWLHTHNLKYPDIRVSMQRLLVPSPMLLPSVLSSANYNRSLGWSHDSAQINIAKLFGCHFLWEGNVTCLGVLLSELSGEKLNKWKAIFQSLGMTVNNFLNLCGRVNAFLPDKCIPKHVDRHSPQIRMPYHDGYVSVFNYPPRTNKVTHGLTQSRLFRMLNGETVLNINALVSSQFTNGLKVFLSIGNALALKQRRQKKVESLKKIRKSLAEWLAPIFEWRLEFKENKTPLSQLESCHGSFEYQFLTVRDEQLPELIAPLFSLLNTTLSNLGLTRKYAFHQELMLPLKNQLKWLLVHLSKEEILSQGIHDSDSLQRYLYLKNIRVFDAQALSNPYCSGVPSLTAVWGMMHRYQRQLNEALGTNIRLTSFSWFIKDFSYVAGKKLPELGMQGAKQDQFRRPGIIDNKYCDLVFDLVIHIDGYEEDLFRLDTQQEILKSTFPTNLAGGVMHQPELGSTDDWCTLYRDEKALFNKLRRLPISGRWLMPTKYKFSNIKELILLLEGNSSLCPTMLGYLLLGKPEKRMKSLDSIHSYAEPAIGVTEYATAIDIRLQGKRNFFKRAFWMLDAQENTMLMKGI